MMSLLGAVASFVYSAIAGTVTGGAGTGVSAGGQLVVNTDGTWQLTRIGATGTPSPSGVQNWVVPSGGAPGNSHWVRATPTLGSVSSGTVNTWLSLSSNRTWTKAATIAEDEVTLTIEIATDSGGSNIVSSGVVGLDFIHS